MTDPKWFVESEYCANKVFQMNSMGYEDKKDWDVDSFKAELAEFGVTAYQHFEATGIDENVSPNALFNVPEYLAAMAANMNSYVNEDGSIGYEGKVDWDEAGAAAELAEHGLSAWEHYTQTGMFEGLNASNAFDTDAYCQTVADNMNATTYQGKTGWTIEDAKAEMQKFGLNPVQHFLVQGEPVERLTKSEVPVEEQVTTTYNPYGEGEGGGEGGIPGETFPLTPEVDVYPGTANDDLITGVVSGTAAENTLNNEDQIDGAGGVNTLEVAMNDDFRGFKGDGYMKNVQNVVLTAAEGEEVEFSAKGVEGVTAYTLNGNVSLADVADTAAAVTINGATEDIGLDFSEVSGTEDALTLSLNAVGVAATEEDEAVYVAVEAGGFESVNLTATGANIVDLSGIGAAKSFTITGDGSLDVAAVGGAVTAIDAQGLAGGIKVDASAASIESFTGGAGNDELTVDAGKVAAKAAIAGGEGEDTVVLNSSAAAATKYTMDSVENFTLGKIEGALTMDASGMSGLSAITVSKDVAAEVTVAKLGDADLAVNLEGAEGATLLVDNEGSTVVNVTGKDETGLTLSNSESVQISVAEKMSYTGTVSANKATDIVIDAQGAIKATINAAAATAITFEKVLENSTLTLDAAKVEDLEGTLGADLTVSGTLSALTSIDFVLQDSATFTYTDAAAKLDNLKLTGEGTAELGAVGTAGFEEFVAEVSGLDSFVLGTVTAGYVDISVTDIVGTASVGAITAADGDKEVNLTVDALDVVTVGAIAATGGEVNVNLADASKGFGTGVAVTADTITFAGSELAANTVTMTAGADADITYTGGVDEDKVSIDFGTGATDAALVLNVDTGVGADVVTVSANGTNNVITIAGDLGDGALKFAGAALGTGGNLTIDLSDFSGYGSVALTASSADASFNFSLGAEADTVVIGQTGAMTVAIDGFDVDGGDKLNVTAIDVSIDNEANFVAYDAGEAFETDDVLLIENDEGTITDAFFNGISVTSNAGAYAIVQGSDDVLTFYKVTANATGTAATVAEIDGSLKLTLSGVDLSDLSGANFAA